MPHLLCLSDLIPHNSLLFLNEPVTILADGMSYSLFDLGLDIADVLASGCWQIVFIAGYFITLHIVLHLSTKSSTL